MRYWLLIGFLVVATGSYFAAKAQNQASDVTAKDGGNPPPPWP